jgi:hypothetical protein
MNRIRRTKRSSGSARLGQILERLVASQERRTKTEVEQAMEVNTAIARHKPSTFNGEGEPSELHVWTEEFEKVLESVCCPDHLKVGQAVFYLRGKADQWWKAAKGNLQEKLGRTPSWEDFKTALKEQYYPPHLQKRKSAEFARFEMGQLTVDQYYKKFMEFCEYCPDDVPTEKKKMQRFELGLPIRLQKLIDTSRYATLGQLYERASELGNLERPERNNGGNNQQSGEKRKESYNPNQQNSNKKPRNNGNYSGDRKDKGKKPLGSEGKPGERVHYCKWCPENHPGKDCKGNLVECDLCGKLGHRAYECYQKNGRPDNHPEDLRVTRTRTRATKGKVIKATTTGTRTTATNRRALTKVAQERRQEMEGRLLR